MKKKIIGIFIIFACIFVMCGCDLSNNKKSNNNTINDTKEKSDIKVYYKDNESINPHLVNPIYLKLTEAEENKSTEVIW